MQQNNNEESLLVGQSSSCSSATPEGLLRSDADHVDADTSSSSPPSMSCPYSIHNQEQQRILIRQVDGDDDRRMLAGEVAASEASHEDHQCTLYMAESSISGAGLGVYTMKQLSKGDILNFPEIVLTHTDLFHNMRMNQLFTEFEAQQWKTIENMNKTDLREDCVILALSGMCEQESDIRSAECAKSCTIHLAGLDVKKSLYFLKDREDQRLCRKWAEYDECSLNPNYMLTECAASCAVVDYGLFQDIAHSREDWTPSHYYWADDRIGTHFEAKDASTFVPGLGSMPNSHLGLVNLKLRGHTVDNAGYHRSKDVGVGAFSSRHNITFEALEEVPAGMELFLDYGDQYFLSKSDIIGHVPLKNDYKKADEILSQFWSDVEELQPEDQNDSTATSIYERILNSITDPRLKNALPVNYQEAKQGKSKSAALLKVPNVVRTREWLEEHGTCLDNLHPGPSTVPQAGRGAFASRYIKKGQVIAPMPLLQMEKRRLRRFLDAQEITPQLSINYSYGHAQSSMVLLPYSPTVNFVNHNFDKSQINAKLQWSSSPFHHNHWENNTVPDILSRQTTGLMMELVATEDIPNGHEVFLDYGPRWEQAWLKHASQWKGPSGGPFDNIEDLNHSTNNDIRTSDEQIVKPYGNNVVIMCWLDLVKLFADVRRGMDHFKWERYRVGGSGSGRLANEDVVKQCEILGRHHTVPDGQSLLEINEERTDMHHNDDSNSTTIETVYTVSVVFDATGSKQFTIKGIPRSEIFFETKKYASDQFVENAFRHVIDIPDQIFPAAWKDLEEDS